MQVLRRYATGDLGRSTRGPLGRLRVALQAATVRAVSVASTTAATLAVRATSDRRRFGGRAAALGVAAVDAAGRPNRRRARRHPWMVVEAAVYA